jgi:ribonuclease E
MSKEIIINAEMAEEVRIAIVEKNRLIDLDIETQSRTKHKGNIYKGIISNIEDSLDAAFVEFGEDKQAFLPMTEIRPELFPAELKGQRRAKISDVLSRGQEIVVQVTKDEIGTKGAAVSTYLSLPGRFVVLMHSDEGGGGISRKIENESARQAARDMLSRLSVPEGLAVIIRTAGMTASRQDLYRDFRQLCEIWQQINKGAQLGRAPTLLYKEPDIVIRTIRDYFSSEVTKIVIDDEEEYEDAHRYFSEHMPDLVKVLERHRKKEPIFLHYGIESAISELYEREVTLPSGGYIIIEPTEALVSIDVNSGKSTKEEGHAATVYKTNLEATDEIARQLRLRDLGGIIVVDFIDMISSKHRRDVEKKMREAMHNDKARVKVGRIGENGTLELTRQRLRQSHHLISHVSCERCKGTGRVRDAEGLAVLALRNINAHLSRKRQALASLSVRLPIDVANALNNQKRRELIALSDSYHLNILIFGDGRFHDVDMEFDEEKRGQAGLDAAAHSKEHLSEVFGGGRQARQISPKESWNLPTRKDLPPPNIGPIPTLIESEFLEAEDNIEAPVAPVPSVPRHYDDPIEEALFGTAPEMDESLRASHDPHTEGEASPESQEGGDAASGVKPNPNRRKRQMRSRRRKAFRQREPGSETPAEEAPRLEEKIENNL